MVACEQITCLEDIRLIILHRLLQGHQSRVDLLRVGLEHHFRFLDQLLEQLAIAKPEREVVFYCSNLVELVELREALVDLLEARVRLEDGEREHGAFGSR